MAVDGTKRPLTIDPRFIPYLEKHRIYELHYDIMTNVAIYKPKDHILFIRNFLLDYNHTRDKFRIILLTPPHISALNLAEMISGATGAKIVELRDLLEEKDEEVLSTTLAFRFNRLIQKEELAKTGWIIHDIPRDYLEAKTFQKCGIFPTHTFEICLDPDKYSENDAWFENIRKWPLDEFKEAMAVHKRKIFGLQKAFPSTYKKLCVSGRSLRDLAAECVDIAKIPVFKGAPILPRIVLIGTRGSRRRTLARLLREKFKMVHVDIEELILQGLESETQLGEELRRLKQSQVRIYGKTVIALLERRLKRRDCLKMGWVLTGIPRDLNDLRALDNLDTPPNKVIFMSVEPEKAFIRLQNRRVNAYNGKMKTIGEIKADPSDNIAEYILHPRDNKLNVLNEQQQFNENFQAMLNYCGDNCYMLDATGTEDELVERASKIITEPGLLAPPRRITATSIVYRPTSEDNRYVLPDRPCSQIYPSQLALDSMKAKVRRGIEFL